MTGMMCYTFENMLRGMGEDDGLQVVDDGLQVVDDGLQVVDDGLQTVDDGLQALDDGLQVMGVDDGSQVVE